VQPITWTLCQQFKCLLRKSSEEKRVGEKSEKHEEFGRNRSARKELQRKMERKKNNRREVYPIGL